MPSSPRTTRTHSPSHGKRNGSINAASKADVSQSFDSDSIPSTRLAAPSSPCHDNTFARGQFFCSVPEQGHRGIRAQHDCQIVDLSLIVQLLNPHAFHRISIRIAVKQFDDQIRCRDDGGVGRAALHLMSSTNSVRYLLFALHRFCQHRAVQHHVWRCLDRLRSYGCELARNARVGRIGPIPSNPAE